VRDPADSNGATRLERMGRLPESRPIAPGILDWPQDLGNTNWR
jgi:hypothetical protein